MAEIEIDTPSTARGIWTFEDRLWGWPPGEASGSLHGFGIYHETYVKLAEGWRVASMEIERLRVEVTLVGASSTLGMTQPPDTHGDSPT
jgi:hypothetical protein